jgi:hypothetical protein
MLAVRRRQHMGYVSSQQDNLMMEDHSSILDLIARQFLSGK